MMETVLTAAAGIVVLAVAALCLWAVHWLSSYICKGIGLMTLAKRRGISGGWLAWLPVGDLWILGEVSDRYEQMLTGRKEHTGRSMLWLTVIGKILVVVGRIWSLISGVVIAELAITATGVTAIGVAVWLVGKLVSMLGTVCSAFEKICCYQLYASCDPKRKVLYMMLTLFLGNGYFICLCRNKDLGMPQAPAPEEEAAVLGEE